MMNLTHTLRKQLPALALAAGLFQAGQSEGLSFPEVLARRPEIRGIVYGRLRDLGHPDAEGFFAAPERYRGLAAEKARALGRKYRELARRWAD